MRFCGTLRLHFPVTRPRCGKTWRD